MVEGEQEVNELVQFLIAERNQIGQDRVANQHEMDHLGSDVVRNRNRANAVDFLNKWSEMYQVK